MTESRVWVTWEKQRRSIELARHLGAELILYDKNHKYNILRYIYASFFTINSLRLAKPEVVFAQNPSLILATLVILFSRILNYVVIIDRHSNFMFNKKQNIVYKLFHCISNYTLIKTDLTLVTNITLATKIMDIGGKVFVLEDKLPAMNASKTIKLAGKFNFVYVCSFDSDEPVMEVIEAFKRLTSDIHMYITGNYKRSSLLKEITGELPANIHLTGYLDEDSYVNTLAASDAVIVLTKSDMTLNCGAYEAVALQKPLILSDTYTIRNYFSSGAVYCDPTTASIETALIYCLGNITELVEQVCSLKKQLIGDWDNKYNNLLVAIDKFKLKCL